METENGTLTVENKENSWENNRERLLPLKKKEKIALLICSILSLLVIITLYCLPIYTATKIYTPDSSARDLESLTSEERAVLASNGKLEKRITFSMLGDALNMFGALMDNRTEKVFMFEVMLFLLSTACFVVAIITLARSIIHNLVSLGRIELAAEEIFMALRDKRPAPGGGAGQPHVAYLIPFVAVFFDLFLGVKMIGSAYVNGVMQYHLLRNVSYAASINGLIAIPIVFAVGAIAAFVMLAIFESPFRKAATANHNSWES